jgi:hypothetical protein
VHALASTNVQSSLVWTFAITRQHQRYAGVLMKDLPVACTLSAEDLGQRRADLLPGLIARAVASEPLDNGLCFRFDASSELLTELVQVIDAERQCCRFLQFEITVAPDLGPISLQVTGPPGTAQFLSGLLDEATR